MLIKPKRSYHKTTNSKHWLHKYPNLLKNKKAVMTNQIWVSDITYIDTVEQTTYLSLITDAYSRKIVGYHLHESLHTDGVAGALQMALKHEKFNELIITQTVGCNIVHHNISRFLISIISHHQ
jgi:putative transposase